MARRTVFLCLPVLAVLWALPALAQEKPAREGDVAGLKAELEKLRDMLEAQKSTNEAEMDRLNKRIKELESRVLAGGDKAEEDELAKLRRLAEAEAETEEKDVTGRTDDTSPTFKAGWLSLQALNPEISVTGDIVGSYRHQEDNRERWDMIFRGLGLHFESYLDPYTKFKAAVPVNDNGAALGEAYMTRFGAAEGLNLTIGKFRQQFGVVNRWHKHALDQVDFPLPLRQIFGNGGLNQTGVSLDYALPLLWGSVQDVTVQITEGSNDRLFGGNTRSTPSVLCRYKNYRDLSKDTYIEWGLTGLWGWNDTWGVQRGGATVNVHDSRSTRVAGADFSLLWEPTDRMRHRNVEWRTELYLLSRDILAPDDSGKDTLNAGGAYSYVQTKLSREWDVGLRLDYYKPDAKDYAAVGSTLAPLAFTKSGAYRWQAGPYVTWHQSPFVKYRLEYNHTDGRRTGKPEDVIMLQVIFSVGPHKHDRY